MATNKTTLFDNTQNGAYWPTGVTFQRANPTPIDKYSIFSTLDDAKEYALHSAVAYPGQIITVIDGDQEYSDWTFEDGEPHVITFNTATNKYSIDGVECTQLGQSKDTTDVTVGEVTATRSITKPYDVKSYQIIDTHGHLLQIANGNETFDINQKIEVIQETIKGGVNYKGHINLDAVYPGSGNPIYERQNLPLSGIFGRYYRVIDLGTELQTTSKVLSSGFLYNITTEAPYTITENGVDVLTVENNDYLIVHIHDDVGPDGIEISALTRDSIDYIEAVEDDYVRFHQLEALSAALSTDIDKLRDNVNADIDSLSTEISGTVAIFNSEGDYVGNKISAVTVTNNQYQTMVVDGTIEEKCLYIIEDDYVNAFGQQIKNLDVPTDLSDATTKEYVDTNIELSTANALNDAKEYADETSSYAYDQSKIYTNSVSAELCSTVNDLSTSLSAQINAEFVHMSGDVGIGSLSVAGNISADTLVASSHDYTAAVNTQNIVYTDFSVVTLDGSGHVVKGPDVYTLEYPNNSGVIALTSDVANLSNDLSSEINAVSTLLSTELSGTIAVFNIDGEYIGNKLSTMTVTNEVYDNAVKTDSLNDKCIYIIDDDFVSMRGQQIRNVADPEISSDAATKNYVDIAINQTSANIEALSTALSNEIDNLSANLCVDVKQLSTDLSAEINALSASLSTSVNSEFVHMSGDVGIGTLQINGNISANEFSINEKLVHTTTYGISSITYIDNSEIDGGGVSKKYNITYPEKAGTIALTSDVADLSNDLSSEINAVSTLLSTELSGTVAMFNSEGDYVGNKLSAVKITNAAYAAAVDNRTVNDQIIYVIDDSYDSAFGHQIKDVADPTNDQDAATKKYVDSLSSTISSAIDVKFATKTELNELALSVDGLSTAVNYVSSDLSTLEHKHYYATLSGIENEKHHDPVGEFPDNLLIASHPDSGTPHKTYYLKFAYGSLVLVECD